MTDLKVFIVEDNELYLNVLERYILDLGYENLHKFTSGEACLDQLHLKPEIIFLDYYMDNLNGLEVLYKIKRFDPNIFVVMISGHDDVETAIEFLKNGGFDYIRKGEGDKSKIESVFKQIHEVREMIESQKPSLFKRLFKS